MILILSPYNAKLCGKSRSSIKPTKEEQQISEVRFKGHQPTANKCNIPMQGDSDPDQTTRWFQREGTEGGLQIKTEASCFLLVTASCTILKHTVDLS